MFILVNTNSDTQNFDNQNLSINFPENSINLSNLLGKKPFNRNFFQKSNTNNINEDDIGKI